MSRRKSIINALSDKFKEINGTGIYTVNLFDNSYPKLKFWDEVRDFPSVYMSAGRETREYLPSEFTWGFLNVSIKLYCKGENSEEELESLISDVETCLDSTNGRIPFVYNEMAQETEEISVTSIVTDEGLLTPYSIGEINILVRYQKI